MYSTKITMILITWWAPTRQSPLSLREGGGVYTKICRGQVPTNFRVELPPAPTHQSPLSLRGEGFKTKICGDLAPVVHIYHYTGISCGMKAGINSSSNQASNFFMGLEPLSAATTITVTCHSSPVEAPQRLIMVECARSWPPWPCLTLPGSIRSSVAAAALSCSRCVLQSTAARDPGQRR